MSNFILNNLNQNSEYVSTRKVLFEKYDKYLGYVLLNDFAMWEYININMASLEDAVERINIKGGCYGEPKRDGYGEMFGSVEIKNISHVITNVKIRGSELYGKVYFLDTPMGKIVKDIKGKGQIKFEIVATGSINNAGETTINEILTWYINF
jgi:hypothetical protein